VEPIYYEWTDRLPTDRQRRILRLAARMGGLPDDHPADALGYRITNLSKRIAARLSTWEGITPGVLAGPRHPELPPSLQSPDRSPGISF